MIYNDDIIQFIRNHIIQFIRIINPTFSRIIIIGIIVLTLVASINFICCLFTPDHSNLFSYKIRKK